MKATPWTPREDRILVGAMTRGEKMFMVAMLVGRSESAVGYRVAKLRKDGVVIPDPRKVRTMKRVQRLNQQIKSISNLYQRRKTHDSSHT